MDSQAGWLLAAAQLSGVQLEHAHAIGTGQRLISGWWMVCRTVDVENGRNVENTIDARPSSEHWGPGEHTCMALRTQPVFLPCMQLRNRAAHTHTHTNCSTAHTRKLQPMRFYLPSIYSASYSLFCFLSPWACMRHVREMHVSNVNMTTQPVCTGTHPSAEHS